MLSSSQLACFLPVPSLDRATGWAEQGLSSALGLSENLQSIHLAKGFLLEGG
jgi:hypothetical protein